jgi:DNA-binding response OmpR family regulator
MVSPCCGLRGGYWSEPSSLLLLEQQEFHQHLRALTQSAVRTVIELVMREELDAFIGAAWDLTKPFSVDELLARVRAVLRRAQFASSDHVHALGTTTTIGALTIDFGQHLVTMADREVELTPIEYRILAYLAQNAGRVVTQDLLLERVWGAEYVNESRMLQVNINRLRRKLEADPTRPRYILTKIGIGYLLASQPDTRAVP